MMKRTLHIPFLLVPLTLVLFLFTPCQSMAQGNDDIVKNPLVKKYFLRLINETEYCEGDTVIFISLAQQELYLLSGYRIIKRYSISSARNGVGCEYGSGQTPVGIHRIWEKIGHRSSIPYIYVRAINTGKKAKLISEPKRGKRDYITTRILWLEGVEESVNCGGNVDSYRRRIYIHGTPEEGLVGSACSSGCIRMLNSDVIELYDLAPRLTYVVIMNDINAPLLN